MSKPILIISTLLLLAACSKAQQYSEEVGAQASSEIQHIKTEAASAANAAAQRPLTQIEQLENPASQ